MSGQRGYVVALVIGSAVGTGLAMMFEDLARMPPLLIGLVFGIFYYAYAAWRSQPKP